MPLIKKCFILKFLIDELKDASEQRIRQEDFEDQILSLTKNDKLSQEALRSNIERALSFGMENELVDIQNGYIYLKETRRTKEHRDQLVENYKQFIESEESDVSRETSANIRKTAVKRYGRRQSKSRRKKSKRSRRSRSRHH